MLFKFSILSFILILVYVVLPGYLLRRFYFTGEFSKQLSTHSGFLGNFIYSLTIGLIYNFFVLLFLLRAKKINLDYDDLISFFISPKENFEFVIADLNIHLIYVVSICLVSIICGFTLNGLVLLFNLDTKFKILRFSNEWYYLFEGKVLNFSKNKKKLNKKQNLKLNNTFLDVLVDENKERPTLYSGLYADHSLKTEPKNSIDKLYLYRASRYKKVNEDKTIKKRIPGDLFIIIGENILNINAYYVFEELESIKNKKFIIKRNLLLITKLTLSVSYILLLIIIIFEPDLINFKFLGILYEKSFFYKSVFFLMLNIFFGLITGFKIDSDKLEIKYDKSNFIFKIILFIFFLILCIVNL